MNFPLIRRATTNMTSKGQVLIPKAVRVATGLVPGAPVDVGIDDRGDVVVRPHIGRRQETPKQRKARIDAAVEMVRGKVDLGGLTTDQYMALVRGPYPDDL